MPTAETPRVTVIVPTMATRARAATLRRALDSIRASAREALAIVVVANGARADPALCDWLRTQRDIRFAHLATPSAPNAVRHGRSLVATPFFSTLDDDDEYLPDATAHKLAALAADPAADLVVSNGYRHRDGRDEPYYTDLAGVADDPLARLFAANWLHNCNALFRSARVGPEFFADYHPYLEWTWLAFRLALAGRKVAVLDVPAFRYHDTPGSLSKSRAYGETLLALYRRMLAAQPPAAVARLIRCRMGAAWHADSVRALGRGERRRALYCHLRSLCLPGAGRYLAYSRRLAPGWPRSA